MEHHLYEMKHPEPTAPLLEEMRTRIAKVAGVTLVGNRLTVRWGADKLIEVHMVILHVEDGTEEPEVQGYDR